MNDLIGDTLENLVRGGPTAERRAAPARTPRGRPKDGDAPAAPPSTRGAIAPTAAAATARVFAVASGKGGTGKSLLAVNLAVAAAEWSRVAILDVDLGLANAHILLGLLPRRDASHLLAGECTLEETVLEGPRGVRLLPGASGIPEMASLDDARLEFFATAITPLLARSDVVYLDCPAGFSRQSLLFMHGADVVAVVTTDDLTSMTDAYALIKTLLAWRPQAAVGLVVNDAKSPQDGSETYRKISHVARKFLGRDILSLGTIPHDPALGRSVVERRPIVLGHPAAPAARAIVELERRLASLRGTAAALSFPERLRRTLAAAARAPAAERNGDLACTS